jgi:putative ABC transport system permease protein
MTAFAGVRRWFHLDRPVQDEVDEELAFHFERATAELVTRGMSPEEAAAEARRRFGDLQNYRQQLKQIDEEKRSDRRRTEYLATWGRNIRLALRSVRRSPGFAAVVAITLGLGVGVNASMFGLLDRLLFTQPALVREPDQVRRVYVTRNPVGRWIYGSHMTYPDILDLKSAKNLDGVFAYTDTRLPLGTGESRQMIPTSIVQPGWFELLGVRPVIGRFLTPADDSAAAGLANAVIGYGFWQRQFGGAPTAIGQTLDLGNGRYTIVGVAPENFSGIRSTRTDVWIPLVPGSSEVISGPWQTSRGFFWISAVARVKTGVTIERAEAEASSLHLAGRSADTTYAIKNRARITLGPLLVARGPASDGQARVALWAGGVSVAVLLVACANVANLLLFRAIRRRREIAVRLALGISRAQLIGEVLTESLVLALIGGAGALLLAGLGGGLLHTLLMPELASTVPTISWRIASFTVAAALAAGFIAGLVPAWLESRPDLLSALKEATAGKGGHTYIRSGLVVVQTALSVMLLVGSGLFLLSLARLRAVDMGVQADKVLVISPDFPKGTTDVEQHNFYRDARERLSGMPGVEMAAISSVVPYNWSYAEALTVPGFDSLPIPRNGGPYYDAVGNNYFETMGMRIVEGRGFGPQDVPGNALTIVITQGMARLLWPRETALGKCMKFGGDTAPCREIVGVVHDTQRDMGMIKEGDQRMQYYLPLAQLPPDITPAAIMLRSEAPLALAGPARTILMQLKPDLRYVETETFEQIFMPDFQSWRTGAGVFTSLGALALVVAGIGLYSLLAYGVVQRTREIGVRIALGARTAKVVGLVLQEGVLLVLGGVVVGLGIALFAARSVAPLLFKTNPTEPLVYLAVAAILLLIAIIAGALPAWRATRVSPMTALRAE